MTREHPGLEPTEVPLTEPQRKLIMAMCGENGWSAEERHYFCEAVCKQASVKVMTMAQAHDVITALHGWRYGLEIHMQRG